MPFFFFFNDTATTEIYTLSLHDALPISSSSKGASQTRGNSRVCNAKSPAIHSPQTPMTDDQKPSKGSGPDRKSTRLNSSHANISYAVFCLKKKKNHSINSPPF